MLKLSDCELANLRLECLKWAYDRFSAMGNIKNLSTYELACLAADDTVKWLLRDRDEPGAGEG